MTNQEALFRTWGSYFKYPQCCIDDFVERFNNKRGVPSYTNESPFNYSGFIPCKCCHNKTKGMDVEEAVEWLGHNPFGDTDGMLESYKNTLTTVLTEEFESAAHTFSFDREGYIEFLESQILKMTRK